MMITLDLPGVVDRRIKDDRPRWEYFCLGSAFGDNYQTFTEKLNDAGFNGWEVIHIVESKDHNPMSPTGLEWKAWMKRKYRFERVLVFGDDKPVGGAEQDNIYYV